MSAVLLSHHALLCCICVWCVSPSPHPSGPLRVDGKDNPTWGLNPQYWLTCPAAGDPSSTVIVKVVLQRTDRGAARDDKLEGPKNKVGLVVTRATPPPPAANTRRKYARVAASAAQCVDASRVHVSLCVWSCARVCRKTGRRTNALGVPVRVHPPVLGLRCVNALFYPPVPPSSSFLSRSCL